MIANALLMTLAVFLAYAFWLMDQLKFMAAYKAVLFHAYATPILASAAVLFLNIFGACLLLQRKLLLKDTGRKLSHLDRQFRFRQIEMPLPDGEETEDDAA
jgi:ABC-type sugar transport system permease subunit